MIVLDFILIAIIVTILILSCSIIKENGSYCIHTNFSCSYFSCSWFFIWCVVGTGGYFFFRLMYTIDAWINSKPESIQALVQAIIDIIEVLITKV